MSELVGHRLVDVGEDEELTFDWSSKLDTDTIASSMWEISPDGSPSPLVDDSIKDDTTTSVTVSGLRFGVTYLLTNTIQTDTSRTLVQSFTLRGSRK